MMKKYKILCLSLLALSACQSALSYSYHAYKPFYIGGELGLGDTHYDKWDLGRDVKVNDSGLAGRLLAGFDINPNLGLELGYTIYQNPEFTYRSGIKSDFSQQSLDLLAKVSLPISCNVSVYAKGGMAYVHRDDMEFVDDDVTVKVNDQTDDHLRPMLGIGFSYGFNARVAGNIGYYRTFGTGDLEDADFYGAGITVRIG